MSDNPGVTRSSGPIDTTDPYEILTLIGLGIAAAPVALFIGREQIRTGSLEALQQATTAGILVAAADQPLVSLPGAAGAGLDIARLLVLAALLGLLTWAITAAILTAARRSRRRRDLA